MGRPGPPWLGRRFPALIGAPRSPTYRYFCEVPPFISDEAPDEILVAAIDKTLRTLAPPHQPIDRRSSGALASGDAEIDLLSHNHVAANRLSSVSLSFVQKSFVEFYEPVSRFVVTLDDGAECLLKMTYRTPAAKVDHDVKIQVNGVAAGAFPASRDWKSVELGNLVLNSGRNELTITWPQAQGATKEKIQQSVGQLRRNVLPSPLIEFGHCYRLRLMKLHRAPG